MNIAQIAMVHTGPVSVSVCSRIRGTMCCGPWLMLMATGQTKGPSTTAPANPTIVTRNGSPGAERPEGTDAQRYRQQQRVTDAHEQRTRPGRSTQPGELTEDPVLQLEPGPDRPYARQRDRDPPSPGRQVLPVEEQKKIGRRERLSVGRGGAGRTDAEPGWTDPSPVHVSTSTCPRLPNLPLSAPAQPPPVRACPTSPCPRMPSLRPCPRLPSLRPPVPVRFRALSPRARS
ncbi:hypothetical protein CLV29_0741 [Naumannella halotolerans]|uniref:Uncharacterized protein n=1 Tax=Naumannella halotolerans TaxID=993414 RepID=A0A4V3ENB2_9ACTN|nr:hypothetical protein CLV29_0741 [Naumannella halotolerans]